MQYSSQKPLDPLIVNIFPLADGQSSSYTLYEDAGDSQAYEHGAYALTDIARSTEGKRIDGGDCAAKGAYPGMPTARAYEFACPATGLPRRSPSISVLWPPHRRKEHRLALRRQHADDRHYTAHNSGEADCDRPCYPGARSVLPPR